MKSFWVKIPFLLFFFAAANASAAPQSETQATLQATLKITVTLVGITAYADYREIRAALDQSEGVVRVALVSEAPGLITLEVQYEGEPQGLADQLVGFFEKKYDIQVKDLPSGLREITIAKKT